MISQTEYKDYDWPSIQHTFRSSSVQYRTVFYNTSINPQAATDVLIEPTNLIPTLPLKRPADVAIKLRTTSNTPTYAAIDVSIPPLPLDPSHPRYLQSSNPKSCFEAHLRCERSKFNGRPNEDYTAAQVTTLLNDNHITLYPFTVDHLGGVGPFARSLLLHEASPLLPKYNDLPQRSFSHASAAHAFQTANQHPLAILSSASKAWSTMFNQREPTFFGSTYRTRTPAQWGIQTLALNTSKALAKHVFTHAKTHQLPHTNIPAVSTLGNPPTSYCVSPYKVYQPGEPSTPHVYYV